MTDAKPPKSNGKTGVESAPPPDPDEVLRRMLQTPPKPHKKAESNLGKNRQDSD